MLKNAENCLHVSICNSVITVMFNCRLAHEAKSEDIRGETMLLELRRQYHCAAYNLMIAFISRTQSELKFYTSFLFEEKQSKVCFSSLKSHNFGCGWLE